MVGDLLVNCAAWVKYFLFFFLQNVLPIVQHILILGEPRLT